MAIHNQVYLPETGTHSAPVAMEFLCNKKNFVCLFHTDNCHKPRLDTINTFYEMPRPAARNNNCKDGANCLCDVLHCGCPLESSLYIFYLWKTLVITSENRNINRPFSIGEDCGSKIQLPHVPDLQVTAFWAKSLQDICDIPVFSLYGGYATGLAQHTLKVKFRRLATITNSIIADHGVPIKLGIREETDNCMDIFKAAVGNAACNVANAEVAQHTRAEEYLHWEQYM